jgi:hypothetical protein
LMSGVRNQVSVNPCSHKLLAAIVPVGSAMLWTDTEQLVHGNTPMNLKRTQRD